MIKKLGLMDVNATFRLGDCSPELKDFILSIGYEATEGKVYTARLCGGTTKKLYNDNTLLGLRIYRDYFKCVDLVYPAYDYNTYYEGQENPKVGYSIVEIGRATKDSIDMSCWDADRYIPTINWLEKHPKVKFENLEKELNSFIDDYRIVEDYDAEAIEEALECGDLDLIEELIGDRDLTEIM